MERKMKKKIKEEKKAAFLIFFFLFFLNSVWLNHWRESPFFFYKQFRSILSFFFLKKIYIVLADIKNKKEPSKSMAENQQCKLGPPYKLLEKKLYIYFFEMPIKFT